MFEGLVAEFLLKYLGNFIQGLNKENLRVGVWSGEVELENLTLQPDVLDALGLPLEIKAGVIGKLRVRIPWSRLGSESVSVVMEDIAFLVSPRSDWKESGPEVRARQKKRKLLLAGRGSEEVYNESNTPRKKSDEKRDTFTARLLSKIIDNVQLSLHRLHVRYEDPSVFSGSPFTVGITLSSLEGKTLNADGDVAFVDSGNIRWKQFTVSELDCYLDVTKPVLLSSADKQAIAHELIASHFSEEAGRNSVLEHQYLVPPVHAVVQVRHDRQAGISKPAVCASINLSKLSLSVCEAQLKCLRESEKQVGNFALRSRVDDLRPAVSPIGNAATWWKYAYLGTLRNCQKFHWKPKDLERRRRLRLCYLSHYLEYLRGLSPDSPEEDTILFELDDLENQLSYEDIILFRFHAIQKRRKERSVEEAKNEGEQKSNSKTGGTFVGSYFSWLNGSRESLAVDKAEEKSPTLTAEEAAAVVEGLAWEDSDTQELVKSSTPASYEWLHLELGFNSVSISFALKTATRLHISVDKFFILVAKRNSGLRLSVDANSMLAKIMVENLHSEVSLHVVNDDSAEDQALSYELVVPPSSERVARVAKLHSLKLKEFRLCVPTHDRSLLLRGRDLSCCTKDGLHAHEFVGSSNSLAIEFVGERSVCLLQNCVLQLKPPFGDLREYDLVVEAESCTGKLIPQDLVDIRIAKSVVESVFFAFARLDVSNMPLVESISLSSSVQDSEINENALVDEIEEVKKYLASKRALSVEILILQTEIACYCDAVGREADKFIFLVRCENFGVRYVLANQAWYIAGGIKKLEVLTSQIVCDGTSTLLTCGSFLESAPLGLDLAMYALCSRERDSKFVVGNFQHVAVCWKDEIFLAIADFVKHSTSSVSQEAVPAEIEVSRRLSVVTSGTSFHWLLVEGTQNVALIKSLEWNGQLQAAQGEYSMGFSCSSLQGTESVLFPGTSVAHKLLLVSASPDAVALGNSLFVGCEFSENKKQVNVRVANAYVRLLWRCVQRIKSCVYHDRFLLSLGFFGSATSRGPPLKFDVRATTSYIALPIDSMSEEHIESHFEELTMSYVSGSFTTFELKSESVSWSVNENFLLRNGASWEETPFSLVMSYPNTFSADTTPKIEWKLLMEGKLNSCLMTRSQYLIFYLAVTTNFSEQPLVEPAIIVEKAPSREPQPLYEHEWRFEFGSGCMQLQVDQKNMHEHMSLPDGAVAEARFDTVKYEMFFGVDGSTRMSINAIALEIFEASEHSSDIHALICAKPTSSESTSLKLEFLRTDEGGRNFKIILDQYRLHLDSSAGLLTLRALFPVSLSDEQEADESEVVVERFVQADSNKIPTLEGTSVIAAGRVALANLYSITIVLSQSDIIFASQPPKVTPLGRAGALSGSVFFEYRGRAASVESTLNLQNMQAVILTSPNDEISKGHPFLAPFEVTVSHSRSGDSADEIHIDFDKISCSLTLPEIFLLYHCGLEVGSGYSQVYSHMSAHFYSISERLREEQLLIANFIEQTKRSTCVILIRRTRFTLLSDLFEQNRPLIRGELRESKTSLHGFGGSMSISVLGHLSVEFFNNELVAWEPVLEPWEISVGAEVGEGKLKQISLSSVWEQALLLNVSEVFLYSLSSFISVVGEEFSASGDFSSLHAVRHTYWINNNTGEDIRYAINDHPVSSQILSSGREEPVDASLIDEEGDDLGAWDELLHTYARIVFCNGWRDIERIPMDHVGHYKFNLKSVGELPPSRMLGIVATRDATKVLHLSSPVVLRNDTDIALEIRINLSDTFVALPALTSKATVPVPLSCIKDGVITLRPLSNDFRWSSRADLVVRKMKAGATFSVVCPPLNTSLTVFHACVAVAKNEKEQMEVIIMPPLCLENSLPCQMQYIVFDSESGLRYSGTLASGAKKFFYGVDLRKEQLLHVLVPGFSCPKPVLVNAEEPAIAKSISLLDPMRRELCLKIENSVIFSFARQVVVYAPYWAINKTGHELLYMYRQESFSGLDSGQLTAGQRFQNREDVVKLNGLSCVRIHHAYIEPFGVDARIDLKRYFEKCLNRSYIVSRVTNDIPNITKFYPGIKKNITIQYSVKDLQCAKTFSEDENGSLRVSFPTVEEYHACNIDVDNLNRSFAEKWHEEQVNNPATAFMFSFASESNRGSKLSIRVENSLWSEAFAIDAEGVDGYLQVFESRTAGFTQRIFDMGITTSSAPAPFQRTRLVSISPRFVTRNLTGRPLQIRQTGTQNVEIMQHGAMMPIEWGNADQAQDVRVRFAGAGWNWSGRFVPNLVGKTILRLRNRNGASYLLQAHVSVKGATISVAFHEEDSSLPPYIIANSSSYCIRINQNNVTLFDDLEPGKQLPYSWDEPCADEKHRLLVFSLPGGPKSDTISLDSLCEEGISRTLENRTGDTVSLRLVVIADGPTRVLHIENIGEAISGLPRASSSQLRDDLLPFCILTFFEVGISIIDRSPQELLYISLLGVNFQLWKGKKLNRYGLDIDSMQFDNMMQDARFPVALIPRPQSTDGLKPPCLVCNCERRIDVSSLNMFPLMEYQLQDLDIRVEQDLVAALLDLVSQAFPSHKLSVSSETPKVVMTELLAPIEISESSDKNSRLSYIESLKIHEVRIYVSCFASGSRGRSLRSTAEGSLASLVLPKLYSIDNASLRLKSLHLEHPLATRQALLAQITSYYKGQLLVQAARLLGHTDVLGNPLGLFSNLGAGVRDFVAEPTLGMRSNAAFGFASGVSKGTRSLVSHSVFGAANTTARLTGSVGHGLARLSRDSQYHDRRDLDGKSRPIGIRQGVRQGSSALAHGVKEGVTGVIAAPYQGAASHGLSGFFKGVGQGLVGVVVKPTAGIFDMASRASEGIRNTTSLSEVHMERRRFPRVISPDGILAPFDSETAKAQALFFASCKRAENEEKFLMFVTDVDSRVVILSTRRLVVLNMATQHAAIDWEVEYGKIQKLTLSEDSLVTLWVVDRYKSVRSFGIRTEHPSFARKLSEAVESERRTISLRET
jgi:hypothetical protein